MINRKGSFLTLLELLIVVVIIYLLFNKMITAYFNPPKMDKETRGALIEQGIDTKSHKAMLDSTRKAVQSINQRELEQLNQINEQNK